MTSWQLRSRTLSWTPMPRIMGIVNTTPDSFSDGGRCILPGDAIDHALRLEDAGADILDIGGESTRPYS
ncbi:MAG: dihydropteroate synthase, partial [Pirellulaceae bacterium]